MMTKKEAIQIVKELIKSIEYHNGCVPQFYFYDYDTYDTVKKDFLKALEG